jgi:hypothetical protein
LRHCYFRGLISAHVVDAFCVVARFGAHWVDVSLALMDGLLDSLLDGPTEGRLEDYSEGRLDAR